MKTKLIVTILAACLFQIHAQTVFAEAGVEATVESEADDNSSRWPTLLKEKFELSDEKVSELQKQGLSYSDIGVVAQLAKDSGKEIDEVAKMRTESKMGWGKIAKDLGVHPKQIGQTKSSLKKEIHKKEPSAKQTERLVARQEKLEKHQQKRLEKQADRAQKQEAKRAHKAHKKGH